MSQTDREQRYSHTESIHIDATPQQVWDVVTNVERTGEWSPVCRAAWWKEPTTGPAEGAWFHGRNESEGKVWETESLVAVANEPTEFTWLVGGDLVRWSYSLTPDGDGTSLVESWAVLPGGFEMFQNHFGDSATSELDWRRDAALSGIPATLKSIKQIVEDDAK